MSGPGEPGAHPEETGASGGAGTNPLEALLSGGLGDLLAQAQAVQQQMIDAQEEAAEAEVVGTAGGGVVRVRVTGAFEFVSVHIDPSAVDPEDIGLLEDLVLAALHDAADRVRRLNEGLMGGATGLLGGLGGAFGLGPGGGGPGLPGGGGA